MAMVEGGDKPHDAFFKALLAHQSAAGALLRERLPPGLAGLLRTETVRRLEASFIDDRLKRSSGDLLLQVDTLAGAPALVYCLVEHKSTPERWTACQLLEYQARIYQWWLKQTEHRGEPLPPVYSMVVYHGEEPWNVPRSFGGLVAAPESSRASLLDFEYELVDLRKIPDGELSKNDALRAGLLALKYAQRAEGQTAVLDPIFRALGRAPELFAVAFRYILLTYGREYDELLQAVRRSIPEEEPMFRTAADQLREEGMRLGRDEGLREGVAQGRREGVAQGKAGTLLRQLSRRFGPVVAGAEQRIRQANEAQLDAWLDRILDAQSVEDVLADS